MTRPQGRPCRHLRLKQGARRRALRLSFLAMRREAAALTALRLEAAQAHRKIVTRWLRLASGRSGTELRASLRPRAAEPGA